MALRKTALLLLFCILLGAKEPVVIPDTSGSSTEEIRQKAKEADTPSSNVTLKDVVHSIDENGTVRFHDIVPTKWEELSPTPQNGYDWIETVYGDWLVGHIRYMYDDDLEFESKEFGIITIPLKDIARIKSYDMMRVNIDNAAIFVGIINYKNGKITITNGQNSYTFDKKLIISIATAKEEEWYFWSGDLALDFDLRQGNSDQSSASLKISLKRRTTNDRFTLDYLGRYSKAEGIKISEDNRINTKYDYFLSKAFFITPVFAEYYQNLFQNIKAQATLGSALGYTFVYTSKREWYVTLGPAYLRTRSYEVLPGESPYSGSFSVEVTSKFEQKLNRKNKLKLDYKATLSDKRSGSFKHHFVTKLENDIIKDKIFIDTAFIWDYVKHVQESSGYTPKNNDYQFLVGAGIRF